MMKIKLAYFCCYALIFFSASVLGNNQINSIRFWESDVKTRLVFAANGAIEYNIFTLDKPHRLVIDVSNTELSTGLPNIPSSHDYIKNIRYGVFKKTGSRFVVDLKHKISYQHFTSKKEDLSKASSRLIVDMQSIQQASSTQKLAQVSTPISTQPIKKAVQESAVKSEVSAVIAPSISSVAEPNTPLIKKTQTPPKKTIVPPTINEEKPKVIIVAIDAGHGGKDPGAIGYRGSREKSITLSIAKALQKEIESDPLMQAFLIRRSDVFVALDKRRVLAKKAKADVFVSIHADAFKRRSARGFSVFALSQRGATSAMAKALAQKENAADTIGGVSLANKDRVLQKVLVDLSLNNTIKESVALAGIMISELKKIGKMHSYRVEQAGFAVLKSADIPSILVETGFITNPKEERNLRSEKYQKKLAKTLYHGLRRYMHLDTFSVSAQNISIDYKPKKRKTSKSIVSRAIVYKVKKGDTLSGIAQRYKVSIGQIRRQNRLSSSRLSVGKKLKITIDKKTKKVKRTPRKRSFTYKVKKGDSISQIAKKYGVSAASIKKANRLRSHRIRVGQKLKITQSSRSHKVRRGDGLSKIALQYGVSVKAIMRENRLKNSKLKVGQRLRIP